MIKQNDYIAFISNLNIRSMISIFFKEDLKIKCESIFEDSKTINLKDVIGYPSQSTYTLHDLLFGSMEVLLEIHQEYCDLKDKSIEIYRDKFKQFYGTLSKQMGYESLITSIDLRICPYCQTQMIYKFRKKTRLIITAQLDHMISRHDNPYLAMSCNNLIPSCMTCNVQLKGNKSFKIKSQEEINKSDYYRLKIKKSSKIKLYTYKKIENEDFEIITSDLAPKYLKDDLEIINRIMSFKSLLRDYINAKNTTKKIKLNYLSLIYQEKNAPLNVINERILLDIYDKYAYEDCLPGFLSSVKKVIDNVLDGEEEPISF